MGVPKDIREVDRPKNTIVVDYGNNTPLRYAVRTRKEVKYVSGGNPQPVNGKIIGHIIDGVYVPIESKTGSFGPSSLSYGTSALIKSVSGDIVRDLLGVFPPEDTYKIITMASLQVINPGITASRMSKQYRKTFLSVYYPGTALSKNTICTFLQALGQDTPKRVAFYQKRAQAVIEGHHVAIDGMLKQDSSSVNDLSAFSFKSRTKGGRNISLLYAYDIEKMEPICAEVFPGNYIDASSYASFIKDNDIRKGVIVADKGFPPSKIQDELKDRPGLHFLTPLKRNDVRITNNNMLLFDSVVHGAGREISCKKHQMKNGRFLYSFRDPRRASMEEAKFVAKAGSKGQLDPKKYEQKLKVFGTIVFESDQDLPLETVYSCYDDRWLLELIFRQYKDDNRLTTTNVQDDFSVVGAEFVNFISTVITSRIILKARETGLLEDETYHDLMDDLSSLWRTVDAPEQPRSDDAYWVHPFDYVLQEMEALGLSIPAEEEPKSKKTRKVKKEASKSEENPNPKKRGRPPKNPTESAKKQKRNTGDSPRKGSAKAKGNPEPKRRGRPKKAPDQPGADPEKK